MAKHEHDPKQKFDYDAELDVAGVIALLEDVLTGLRSGELLLEHGSRSITLRPHGEVSVEIEARHKPGEDRLRLELEWRPEPIVPKLRVGASTEPSPIRRKGVVALKQTRRTDENVTTELEISAEALARLPKERLYALAQTIGLDGRSQLPKSALTRELAKHDLRGLLSAEDLQLLSLPT